MDLFGEETEEEKKAAEERAASVKASAKKKECKIINWALFILLRLLQLIKQHLWTYQPLFGLVAFVFLVACIY